MRETCLWALAKLRIVALGVAVSAGLLFSAEDYSGWVHSKKIVINTSPDGANVTTNLRHFPLLVRLEKPAFPFAEASGTGKDLRFAKSNGMPLSYQIEHWDSTKGQAAIWVSVDTIYGNQKTQAISMYWGKSGALDSSNGKAVFDTANGFVAAWHFGETGMAARANSVAGGLPATPVNYVGTESKSGFIGMADSLNGIGNTGAYLNVGTGYADFTSGFTYSVWAFPTAAGQYSRLFDFGNGQSSDNINFFRFDFSNDLSAEIFGANASGGITKAPGSLVLSTWQQFVLTVNASTVSIYKDGALVASGTTSQTIRNITRTKNYLGKSNWDDPYFQGKFDETELSRVARSSDWIRASYANQKMGQLMLTFVNVVDTTPSCSTTFNGPADTTISENVNLNLIGVAGCATGYTWSIVSGPAPRILDPEVKSLQVFTPRVSADAVLVYRFTGYFPSGDKTKDVKVTVKESIPDPIFTLQASLDWNGLDSLEIKPTITNLAAIKATPDSVINSVWTISGGTVDTVMIKDGLILKSPASAGPLEVKVCVDNGGASTCQSTIVTISATVALKNDYSKNGSSKSTSTKNLRRSFGGFDHRQFDASGRRIPVSMRLY